MTDPSDLCGPCAKAADCARQISFERGGREYKGCPYDDCPWKALEKDEAERDRLAANCAAKDVALEAAQKSLCWGLPPHGDPQALKLHTEARVAVHNALFEDPGAAWLAERDRLREALKPFAEAGKDLDENDGDDRQDAWESPAAMSVTLGDFRKAGRALDGQSAQAKNKARQEYWNEPEGMATHEQSDLIDGQKEPD